MNETPPNKEEQEKLTPHEFVKKLVDDPDHKITDEDFENLDMNTDEADTTNIKEQKKLEEVEPSKQEPPNPYVVLGE